MALTIKAMLLTTIAALAALIISSTGFGTYRSVNERRASEAFLAVNETAELLIRTAGQWAVERGLTNAPLNASNTESLMK